MEQNPYQSPETELPLKQKLIKRPSFIRAVRVGALVGFLVSYPYCVIVVWSIHRKDPGYFGSRWQHFAGEYLLYGTLPMILIGAAGGMILWILRTIIFKLRIPAAART